LHDFEFDPSDEADGFKQRSMTAPKNYRSAVVGLGQVGLLFDSDARRSGVWTHFTAYERLSKHLDLVAVCDPDRSRQELAKQRRTTLRCYDSLQELLDGEQLDIVSLCTPPEFHAEQIVLCAGRVKAVICEKPLSTDSQSARCALEACRNTGTLLVVNYYKRFDGMVPSAKAWLDDGRIGRVKLVNGIFCGPLGAVGSHMVDLLRFLFGELKIENHASRADDRYSILLQTESNTLVHLHNVGPREEFIFEMDAIGEEGRIRLLNNCVDCEFLRYRDSDRYSGYRELYPVPPQTPKMAERFLPLFLETVEALRGERQTLSSDGENALRTQLLIDGIADLLAQ
jgi:predicted dehydrogenase